MIVSEQMGWLEGFQYSAGDETLELQIAAPRDMDMNYLTVPFNVNRPKEFALDDFRNKKVKIIVEIKRSNTIHSRAADRSPSYFDD